MTDSNDGDGTDGSARLTTTNRRNVLWGLGAVGVGSSFSGLAQANGRSNGKNRSGKSNCGQGADELPISTQFWTYNNADFSVAELIYESANAGYDAVEPYYIDDGDAVDTALEETGIELSSGHVAIGQLQDDFEGTIEMYSEFGTDVLIHPWRGPEKWNTEEDIVEWAEQVNEMADRVAAEGMEFGYHNHDHEFRQIGDRYGYDIFAEHINDNVHLELDVGWVLAGGANPVTILNRYSDNIRSLHMKDMAITDDGYDFVEIGTGDVDMKAIVNVARGAADVDRLIYEYDGAPNPVKSLYHGAEYLERWNGPRHRSGVPSETWPPRVVPGEEGLSGDPPSDATILWDGAEASLDSWQHLDGSDAQWFERGNDDSYDYFEINSGTGGIEPEEALGDCHLHLEWREPEEFAEIEGHGQGPGNSGLFMMESYEFQILQSYDNPTYPSGYAGSYYLATPDDEGDSGSAPLVLPIRPPGEWNEYDILWRGPRSEDGELIREPQVTLFFNGVAVQVHNDIPGPNWWVDIRDFFADNGHPQSKDGELLEEVPFYLQDHGGDHEGVHFRNVWYRDLPEYKGPNDPPKYDTADGDWETGTREEASDPDHPAQPEWVEPGGHGTTGAPPGDADVLIDDKLTLKPVDGDWESDKAYGDAQFHVEYRIPEDVEGDGSDRGASGVLMMGAYEIQIVDTYMNGVEADEWAGAYLDQAPPHCDAVRRLGKWQQLDIVWQGPRFEDGDLEKRAQVTAFLNGVAVQTRLFVNGPNGDGSIGKYAEHASALPLRLQEDGSRLQFRNTWARSLD